MTRDRAARRRRRSAVVLGAVVATAAAGIAGLALISRGPRRTPTAAEAPPAPTAPTPGPPVGAWRSGGRPSAGDPAVRAALEVGLGELSIQLDRLGRAATDAEAEAAARGLAAVTATFAGVPPPVGARLVELATAARMAVVAEPARRAATAAGLDAAVRATVDELAAAGLGYYLALETMTEPGRAPTVLLFSFEVDRVSLYRGGGRPIRALRLRRLDHLGFEYTLLGFAADPISDAVVLLEPFDALLGDLLPALAGGPTTMLGPRHPIPRWRAKLDARITAVVAAELGPDVPAAQRQQIGRLAAARSAALAATATRLARSDTLLDTAAIPLDRPPPADLVAVLTPTDSAAVVAAAAAFGGELAGDLALLRDQLVESIERHEVQHKVDLQATPLPMPAALAALTGRGDATGDGASRGLPAIARAELSAYLAGIAHADGHARLAITQLLPFLLEPDRVGTPESYVAVAIVDALGSRLALPPAALAVRGAIDEDAVVERYLALTARPSAELAAAAAALWSSWFERPLPALALEAPGSQIGP